MIKGECYAHNFVSVTAAVRVSAAEKIRRLAWLASLSADGQQDSSSFSGTANNLYCLPNTHRHINTALTVLNAADPHGAAALFSFDTKGWFVKVAKGGYIK